MLKLINGFFSCSQMENKLFSVFQNLGILLSDTILLIFLIII